MVSSLWKADVISAEVSQRAILVLALIFARLLPQAQNSTLIASGEMVSNPDVAFVGLLPEG